MAEQIIPPPPGYRGDDDETEIPPPPGYQPSTSYGEDQALTQPQIAAQPAPENWLVKNYRDYVADPLTRAVATAPGYSVGNLDVRDPNAGQISDSPMVSPETARNLVPQTPAGGLAALASVPFGGTLLKSILAPAIGAGVGSALSGNPADEVVGDVALHGAVGGVAKKASDLMSWLYRGLPYMKDRIAEANARGFAGTMSEIDPAVGAAVAGQEVSPYLKGGTTMAKLRQAATGGEIQDAASTTMQTAIDEINTLSGNPRIAGPALNEGYGMLEDVVKNQIIGPVGINGYTLEQAQAIRSEIAWRS
jgi:hypothetical protein